MVELQGKTIIKSSSQRECGRYCRDKGKGHNLVVAIDRSWSMGGPSNSGVPCTLNNHHKKSCGVEPGKDTPAVFPSSLLSNGVHFRKK